MVKKINFINGRIGIFLSGVMKYGLPSVSWLLFAATFALEKGSRERMGIYRDLVVRKKFLDTTILRPELLKVYTLVVIIGILICSVMLIKIRLDKPEPPRDDTHITKYLVVTIITSALLWLMADIYSLVSLLSYPLMFLAMMVVVTVQYVRVIWVFCFN